MAEDASEGPAAPRAQPAWPAWLEAAADEPRFRCFVGPDASVLKLPRDSPIGVPDGFAPFFEGFEPTNGEFDAFVQHYYKLRKERPAEAADALPVTAQGFAAFREAEREKIAEARGAWEVEHGSGAAA